MKRRIIAPFRGKQPQCPHSRFLLSVLSVQSVVHCFRRSYTGSRRALEPATLRVFVRLPGCAEEAGKACEVAFRQVAELPGAANTHEMVQLFQELQSGARNADLHDPAVVGPAVAVD